MKDIKSIFKDAVKNPKWLVIIGLAGILLISVSGFFQGAKNNEETRETTTAVSAEQYKQQLESQIKGAVSHVTGGKVSVMITLNSDIEYVYASEGKNSNKEQQNGVGENNRVQKDQGSENNYVIVKDSNGNESPLVVTAVMPKVKGAVVNCDGGDDPATKAAVTEIVTTALNIDEDKVCVLGFYE